MQSISLDIMIQVDEIKTIWTDANIIVENKLACDKFGNKIEGYSLKETKIPSAIITHKGVSVNLKELNKSWGEFCNKANYWTKIWGTTDDCLRIFHDSINKDDVTFFLILIEVFFSEIFKCEFTLNRKEV